MKPERQQVAMPNATAVISMDEVKTPVDQIFYLNQECTSAGLATTLYTCVAGIVTIPLMLKLTTYRIPIRTEYKILTGTVMAVGVSYFAGVYAKKKCEEDLRKQFAAKLRS